MNDDKFLARFGISSKLAYGLIAQSILVIIVTIISIWGVIKLYPNIDLKYITNFISLLVCITLLIYSFYGFNAKKYGEIFFVLAIVLYVILTAFGLFTTTIDMKNPASILTLVILISTIFFLHDYKKQYKSANYAMLIILISSIIVIIFNMMAGMQWFIAIKYIIIPFTIGLTYFERVQRGKYDFKI
jgi:hypothetical protein